MKSKRTASHEDEGHILPRAIRPPMIGQAKAKEGLAWGQSIGTNPMETIVMCFNCKEPIYIVYTPVVLNEKMGSWKTKAPLALGKYEVPKRCDDPCPKCGKYFARFNEEHQSAQYLTNKGIM